MRTGFCTILFLLFVIGVNSCQQAADEKAGYGRQLAVSWELVSNFTAVENGFKARFTLTNNSDEALTDTNWALFFNMSPRPILPVKTTQRATVQHINGDWYKLIPTKGFSLKPGASTEIHYEGTEAVTKVTDAPLGLYVVFYDKEGKEENIVQIANYTIKPFTRKEQRLRGVADLYPMASSEHTYRANLALSLLPAEQLQKIIPSPARLTTYPGMVTFNSSLSIYADKSLDNEARFLSQKLKALTGKDVSVSRGTPAAKAIVLKTGPVRVNGVSKEAYTLHIDEKGILITGNDAAGVFYGIQSLLALLPTEAYLKPTTTDIALNYTQIEDAPRFAFRGMHLDVSRNFQTKETILRLLDLLAFYKVNQFLFYTTEDEGWRLEIDGLPELTQVGAQREHTSGKETSVLHPAYGSGPKAYDKGKYGSGYYTKADFIEILKYAKERHIKVIPELNLPGHARAAIKAMEARYERLMKAEKNRKPMNTGLLIPTINPSICRRRVIRIMS